MITSQLILVYVIACLITINSSSWSCTQFCQELQFYDSGICYRQCNSNRWFDYSKSIDFSYRSQRRQYSSSSRQAQSSNNYDSSISQWGKYDFRLSQVKDCLQKFFRDDSYYTFTKGYMDRCLKLNGGTMSISSSLDSQGYSFFQYIMWGVVALLVMGCCCSK